MVLQEWPILQRIPVLLINAMIFEIFGNENKKSQWTSLKYTVRVCKMGLG
jgi:hypothetical protein